MSCARRLLALALLGAICGCGPTEAAPDAGKTLIFARVKDAVILDPAVATDGLSLNITAEVFQNLVRFKPGTSRSSPTSRRPGASLPTASIGRST